MSVFSDLPAHDNAALMCLRLVFGSLMVVGLVLGLVAIRRRDVGAHQRWMARSYAVAQGAGTQALFLLPYVILVGQPSGNPKALVMGLAWAVNLAVAEWLVRRSRVGGLLRIACHERREAGRGDRFRRPSRPVKAGGSPTTG